MRLSWNDPLAGHRGARFSSHVRESRIGGRIRKTSSVGISMFMLCLWVE